MLRNLLAERFGLVVHHETKDIRGYDLVIAKNGPRMKEWIESAATPALPPLQAEERAKLARDSDGFLKTEGRSGFVGWFSTTTGGPHFTARQQTIAELINQLTRWVRPIADKTALTGKYDYTLGIELGGPTTSPDDLNPHGPDLFSALQQ